MEMGTGTVKSCPDERENDCILQLLLINKITEKLVKSWLIIRTDISQLRA